MAEMSVVLLNGTELGVVRSLKELRQWVDFTPLPKSVMVHVESPHHLKALNGNGVKRKFAMVGCGVFKPPLPQTGVSVISFINIRKQKGFAVVPNYKVHSLGS